MHAHAIIGANYGDEGKGLMTDYLADNRSIVIRYNGGAQAGHTVVTPEGRRHVFHHIGSGALRGADTFLSKHFIVNPVLFEQEYRQLDDPKVIIDPLALVTTPLDMLLGRLREEKLRHGSCGIGINETVVRNTEEPFLRLTFSENARIPTGDDLLYYAKHRAKKLQVSLEGYDVVKMMDDFVDSWLWMYNHVDTSHASEISWDSYRNIVFEGAQGLGLDEVFGHFPHVTRSRTGIHNIELVSQEIGVKELTAIYVTRTYLTRHGNGPLEGEDSNTHYHDSTNVLNAWQGGLRFAPLAEYQLSSRINRDLNDVKSLAVLPKLAVTHVDQCPYCLEALQDATGVQVGYSSCGETRNHIYKF